MEIYAELSQRLLQKIEKGNNVLATLPSGVTLSRKNGSKVCHFECENKSSMTDLTDLLDNNQIPWQLNDEEIKETVDRNSRQ
jgi:hypothetical protein